MAGTPGPWRAGDLHGGRWNMVFAGGRAIAQCDPDPRRLPGDGEQAELADTARLIAAAPDLLAALRMFVAAEDDWNKRDGTFDDPLTDAYHAAKAAIAKADA